MSTVGDNIRRIRQSLGLPQEELGRAIGHTGGSYISAIENGRKYPSAEMLDRIADGLGLRELGLTPGDLKLTTCCGHVVLTDPPQDLSVPAPQ